MRLYYEKYRRPIGGGSSEASGARLDQRNPSAARQPSAHHNDDMLSCQYYAMFEDLKILGFLRNQISMFQMSNIQKPQGFNILKTSIFQYVCFISGATVLIIQYFENIATILLFNISIFQKMLYYKTPYTSCNDKSAPFVWPWYNRQANEKNAIIIIIMKTQAWWPIAHPGIFRAL